MKFKISANGHLSIYRGDRFVQQICPYAVDVVRCGEDCPLFGEAIKQLEGYTLSLCTKTLAGEFQDERIQRYLGTPVKPMTDEEKERIGLLNMKKSGIVPINHDCDQSSECNYNSDYDRSCFPGEDAGYRF